MEKQVVGDIMTDALIMGKAAEFVKYLQISTFKASKGWVRNFEKNYTMERKALTKMQATIDKKEN